MRNLRVTASFCGAAYHGFQRQSGICAVQNVIEDTLSQILKQKTVIYGCSRTDAGVHANEFVFSFRTECAVPCRGLIRGMNSLLPDDIAILACEDVPQDFHARYSCKGKEYKYLIHNAEIKDPFLYKRAYHYPYRTDAELMDRAARLIKGTHDFSAFCGSSGLKDDNVRTVTDIGVERSGDMVVLTVSADGFLYNMVRIICGTLIFVNEGRLSCDDVERIIRSCNRDLAGPTAPPDGLYLNKVFY
ncbi:MAG: tRNA pseudouridine(38-40) synthase TruA [Oscillospiraceae bacterium]|nr:tRNA pseudouridine(38-40) synthase TruA [Oscillospiraceae bacterium]